MRIPKVPFYLHLFNPVVAPFLYAECALLFTSLYASTGGYGLAVVLGLLPPTAYAIAYYRFAPDLVYGALRRTVGDARSLINTYIFYMESRVATTRGPRIHVLTAFLRAVMDYTPTLSKMARRLVLLQYMTLLAACAVAPLAVDSLPINTAMFAVGSIVVLCLPIGLVLAQRLYGVEPLLKLEKMVQKDLRLC